MTVTAKFLPPALGWLRDLPDPRDFLPESPPARGWLAALKSRRGGALPGSVDLRADGDGDYFLSPDNQLSLNCSPASACLALVEYFQRRALGVTLDGSVQFLYQMTRSVLGRSGNSPVDIRTTLKSLLRYGTPPADLWPFRPDQHDQLPSQLSLLGYADAFRGIRYVRVIAPGCPGQEALQRIKSFLAAGFPLVFGFPVPRSLTRSAVIPFRPELDSYRGGQAVVAVGYRNRFNSDTDGALLVRNSWGAGWGEDGFGWLPCSYVVSHLAVDFWTILHDDWLAAGEFKRPSVVPRA